MLQKKGQTHYINNKTFGPSPAGSWTAKYGFRTVCGFRGFRYLTDVAFEWISCTSWISIFRQTVRTKWVPLIPSGAAKISRLGVSYLCRVGFLTRSYSLHE